MRWSVAVGAVGVNVRPLRHCAVASPHARVRTETPRAQPMTSETSPVRRRAVELSSDVTGIIGPLSGYHHEAYAFPLPPDAPLRTRYGFGWGKLRVPRSGLFWFDRRCFRSEDLLLRALQRLSGSITQV